MTEQQFEKALILAAKGAAPIGSIFPVNDPDQYFETMERWLKAANISDYERGDIAQKIGGYDVTLSARQPGQFEKRVRVVCEWPSSIVTGYSSNFGAA